MAATVIIFLFGRSISFYFNKRMGDNPLLKSLNYLNWVDLTFIVLIIYFTLTSGGLLPSLFDLFGFFFSFIFSFKTYSFFAKIYLNRFSILKGMSSALGFATSWFLAEFIFSLLSWSVIKKLSPKIFKSKINIFFAFIPSIFQATLFYAFILTLLLALPVKLNFKTDILTSKTGPLLISFSQKLEEKLKPVFNEAIIETLNFLTIKPDSEEMVFLNFTLNKNDLKIDPNSEQKMFNLINKERKLRNLPPLTFDEKLRETAEEYGQEMFIYGFFSHYSKIDHSSPAERLNRKNIQFFITGENLAYAPDVQIAHRGFMESEGHRANILSVEFKKVGIGVVEGGIFGKIFVQEFTD